MNATAELASRWTTTTDAAASSSSTPNGQHSLLNQDTDSSSSNAFYGQNFGINLIDDSSLTSLAANPAQLQQLINFSDLGGQLQQQQPQHPTTNNSHHQPQPHAQTPPQPPTTTTSSSSSSASVQQQQQHASDLQEQQQQLHIQQQQQLIHHHQLSSSTPPQPGGPVHQMVTSSSQHNPAAAAMMAQQQQQQLMQPGQTISFNGLLPQPGTIRSATTTTTTTTNGLQQIFLNPAQLQQHQQQILLQQQQQILMQQQQQVQAQQVQAQQQQQQQQLANQLAGNPHGLYNLQATNSVSGQFKVEPITNDAAALCLQEHYRQQQQQIALQTQIQLQYQLQQQQAAQQQQQQQTTTTQLIDMNGVQQQFVQFPANYNLQQFQGMVMAMQQQQQQQQPQTQQRILIMGADGRTYQAVNAGNGELEYVDDEEEEEEDEEQQQQQQLQQIHEECEEEETEIRLQGEGEGCDDELEEEQQQQEEDEEVEEQEEDGTRRTTGDQMTVQLPMTNSSNHCDIINGGGGGPGGGLVITTTNGQPANGGGGPGGAYQQIGFYDRATGRTITASAQGLFNQQLIFHQHQVAAQQQQQQRLGPQTITMTANGQMINGGGGGVGQGGPIQLLMPATHLNHQQAAQQQISSITYQQVNQQQQQILSVPGGGGGGALVEQQQQRQMVEDRQPQQQQQINGEVQQVQQVAQQQQGTNKQPWLGANAGKKIKPVLKPGLVLQTPIAFQGNVDPSQIPIQRDGMAVCERCGAIGVKHSFYTKFKSFCSLNCARNFEEEQLKKGQNGGTGKHHPANSKGGSNNNNNHPSPAAVLADQNNKFGATKERRVVSQHGRVGFRRRVRMMSYEAFASNQSDEDSLHSDYLTKSGGRMMNYHLYSGSGREIASDVLYRDLLPQDDIPELEDMPLICPEEDRIETVNRRKAPMDVQNSYDWSVMLSDRHVNAAPVSCFRHVPGHEIWSKVVPNMKVEVENTDCDSGNQTAVGNVPHAFWVATVLQIHGFKALLRYEGFDDDSSHDFWVNLCSSEVHNVGWCATRGKPLIPPKSIEGKYSDWKSFLMQRLYNARTLSSSFYNRLSESLKSRFRVGLQLEIVDKEKISQVRLATVEAIVGKRLHVKYNDNGDGFFCHEDSALIHHVGWAAMVGHKIKAPMEYLAKMAVVEHGGQIRYEEDDATVDLFRTTFSYEDYTLPGPRGRQTLFRKGMKLEAIDPLNPSSICVASVMSVLNFGYLMIRIDVYEPLIYGDDWFCYHETSPYIFPVGFCHENGLELTPPKGYDAKTFNWEAYLRDTRTGPATPKLFKREVPRHNFEVGMKIECADLMDPKLVCVATISRIVGRLMRINFDGWEDVYDQWLDIESPDMYPVGWCFLVKHRLEGPKVAEKPQPVAKVPRKRGRGKAGKGEGKTPPGAGGKGKGKAKLKAIKMEPMDDMLGVKRQQEQLRHQKAMREAVVSEELELLKESRRLGTMDLEEDSTSRLMGGSSLTDDVHADEFSLSAVGGEDLLMDEEEGEEEEDVYEEPEPIVEKKKGKVERVSLLKSANVSSSSSSYSPVVVNKGGAQQKNWSGGDEQEQMVGSSTNVMDMDESNPEMWTVSEVCQFLMDRDCAVHCECFKQHKVDGQKFLKMSKDDIITVLGMKVGPALKIFDLITQLKDRMDPLSALRRK